jgi:NADH:ubiquinone reductase (non-electrogenic)
MQQLLELASLPGVTEEEQRSLLHIALIGGGPTGVEMAAEMSDLFSNDLSTIYPHLKGKMAIAIYDVAHAILGTFDESLREYAVASFSRRDVEVYTNVKIQEVASDRIIVKGQGDIGCGMAIWVTGNKQCPLVTNLGVAKTGRPPRILTDQCLRVLSDDKEIVPGVFALGDAADIECGTLPTTAEVAVQKAKYLATALNKHDLDTPFEYRQKTLVAYIGGHDGVVQGKTGWSGTRAWAAWRSKNLFWTRSWRRKIMIMANWLLD